MERKTVILVTAAFIAPVLGGTLGCPEQVGSPGGDSEVRDAATLDTDFDGLLDSDEAAAGTDPFFPDSDFDGLLDGFETRIGTDPLNFDTDGDLIFDGQEVDLGLDPLSRDQLAFVREVYCEDYIAISANPGSLHGVFENRSASFDFSTWRAGNQIAIGPEGSRLTNVQEGTSIVVRHLGETRDIATVEFLVAETAELGLRSVTAFGGLDTYQLTDASGMLLVSRWIPRQTVVVVSPCDDVSRAWSLINVPRCERVEVVPTSFNFVSIHCD